MHRKFSCEAYTPSSLQWNGVCATKIPGGDACRKSKHGNKAQ